MKANPTSSLMNCRCMDVGVHAAFSTDDGTSRSGSMARKVPEFPPSQSARNQAEATMSQTVTVTEVASFPFSEKSRFRTEFNVEVKFDQKSQTATVTSKGASSDVQGAVDEIKRLYCGKLTLPK